MSNKTHLYFSDPHRRAQHGDEGVSFEVEIIPGDIVTLGNDRARITIGAFVDGEKSAFTMQKDIELQTGTQKEYGVNGLRPENLIAIAITQLTHSDGDSDALGHLYKAKDALDKRTHKAMDIEKDIDENK